MTIFDMQMEIARMESDNHNGQYDAKIKEMRSDLDWLIKRSTAKIMAAFARQ